MGWIDSHDVADKDTRLRRTLAEASKQFDRAVLLSNLSPEAVEAWRDRISITLSLQIVQAPLTSPVDYEAIYSQARSAVLEQRAHSPAGTTFSFLLTSGTPPMASVWLLLAKGAFEAELVAWSQYGGVGRLQPVVVPFAIEADVLPQLAAPALRRWWAAEVDRAFEPLIGKSAAMVELRQRANQVARSDFPVLIHGESGTGKEVLARAIHEASPRKKGPFVAVNCAAITPSLMQAELFGHVKGAFTGADQDRLGHFQQANGGTLFLDEIAELDREAQAALLRPLQEYAVTPVGSSKPVAVDVRIVAASHRSLPAMVQTSEFRADLFHRLAVAILEVPALRQRNGDVAVLVEELWTKLAAQRAKLGFEEKVLGPAARRRLVTYSWPGNVRELYSVLARLTLWADSPVDANDVEATLGASPIESNAILDRPIRAGFDLQALQSEVARHYLRRALEQTGGNKTRAAELLGLGGSQVVSDWIKRHRVKT